MVPYGSTLIVNEGISINGNNQELQVAGTLIIRGTSSNRVKISDLDIKPATSSQDKPHSFDISYLDMSKGSLYYATGNSIYGSISVIHSTFDNIPYMYIWYPLGTNKIEYNKFTNSGGISYGLDGRPSQGRSDVILSIKYNSFRNQTGRFAVRNWALYGGSTAIVEYNSFLSTNLIAVELPEGNSSALMDAPNNYWGTTDTSVIESMIYDKNDSLNSNGYIKYTPFLSSPAADTPQ
jgi:hypothetical protein